MMAPKGSGFLHVRREAQHLIEPLIVSWGWHSDQPSSSQFVDHHEWQGTRDISAFLTVPAAIRFMEQHDWGSVAKRCSRLLHEFVPQILAATDEEALTPNSSDWFTQMASFAIPTDQWEAFKKRLCDQYQIEAPTIWWNDRTLLRISVNAYNTAQELQHLTDAILSLLSS
jgi:isopenicillin-N epimerase